MLATVTTSYQTHQGTGSFVHPTKKPPDISEYEALVQKPVKQYSGVESNYFNKPRLMKLVEDFSDYFYSNSKQEIPLDLNETLVAINEISYNCSLNGTVNVTCYIPSAVEQGYNYWALLLLLFPLFTLFGNALVILSVIRERALQTVTNYFIVSLAVADLLVAVVVMPFGVYYLMMGIWGLPPFMCDFYIAMDVTSSTSSIFNLVAISIDRYIAVIQPIKYAKHRNSRRVWITILMVWLISAAIGAPVVLGLNDTPDRNYDECLFNSQNYVIYSSLGSFYIPCIMMTFLYLSIFKALKKRLKKQKAARRPPAPSRDGRSGGPTAAVVVKSVGQHAKFAETVLIEMPTNTGSGSNEEEQDSFDKRSTVVDIDVEAGHFSNEKSGEFVLATVTEETNNSNRRRSRRGISDPNGNNDSGYVPSNVEEIAESPGAKDGANKSPVFKSAMRKNGKANLEVDKRNLSLQLPRGNNDASTSNVGPKVEESTSSSAASRFTIYKANKASKNKREKSSAKKERKATKTLAIVLAVFLICWSPFFTCNVLDAICTKIRVNCAPGVTPFILTTWLGYINSFLNPVIYTIFNPEFRKAFRKILHLG